MDKQIVILSFSNRKNGNCTNISQFISNYYTDTDISCFTIDAGSFPSCGNCDCECLKGGMICPNLTEQQKSIMNTICNSNLVYFVLPNYCGYPCANYFAFNERSVGYFGMDQEKMDRYMSVPKRFVIVSNTEGFENAMRQQTNAEPEILYMKSRKYKRRSVNGDILDSDTARADLAAFLATYERTF